MMDAVRGALPALLAAAMAVAGCSAEGAAGRPVAAGQVAATGVATSAPSVTGGAGSLSPSGTAAVPLAGRAPEREYAAGTRILRLSRGAGRPLPTTVFFPAVSPAAGSVVAEGRFPVVVFSHGLTGLPPDYRDLLTAWAAAGFVVAAPAYPHTSRGVPALEVLDVLNQPADASHVLTELIGLDAGGADPLAGHLDTAHVAAAGHSAGAITTVGLFTAGRDPRLSAGIVLAGNSIGVGEAFTGPAAPLLFVHGDADPITPYRLATALYDLVPWPKAFLSMPGQRHTEPYLRGANRAFPAVAGTTLDFLRWTLYGDAPARSRLPADAERNGAGHLDDRL